MRVKHRRQPAANQRAIIDRGRAIAPLGHDLDSSAVATGDVDADQPKPKVLEERLHQTGDLRRDAGLVKEARIEIVSQICHDVTVAPA